MSPRPRWIVGLALVVGVGGALVATRLQTASAGRPTALPNVVACATPPMVGPGAAARPGSFFKIEARLDSHGSLAGQQLVVGTDGQARAISQLPGESSASGPIDGVVALAADDGEHSTVRLVSAVAGCSTVAYTTDDVVRRAVIDAADGSVVLHLVSRATRADLGVWQLPRGASEPLRILEPLPAALGLGTVWGTDLRLRGDGRLLAVQSCADRGCLTRVVDLGLRSLAPVIVRGSSQGPLLGFAGDRLVTWAACDGIPCALIGWDAAGGVPTQLLAGATAAGLTGDGSLLVALSSDGSSEQAVVIDVASDAVRPLRGVAAGDRPIAIGGLAATGLEVAPDQLAMAQRTGDPHPIRPTAAGEVLP